MDTHDKIQREILPIPDPQHVGLTTYDAKDPEWSLRMVAEGWLRVEISCCKQTATESAKVGSR